MSIIYTLEELKRLQNEYDKLCLYLGKKPSITNNVNYIYPLWIINHYGHDDRTLYIKKDYSSFCVITSINERYDWFDTSEKKISLEDSINELLSINSLLQISAIDKLKRLKEAEKQEEENRRLNWKLKAILNL